jgi:hypothetical protein
MQLTGHYLHYSVTMYCTDTTNSNNSSSSRLAKRAKASQTGLNERQITGLNERQIKGEDQVEIVVVTPTTPRGVAGGMLTVVVARAIVGGIVALASQLQCLQPQHHALPAAGRSPQ